MHCLCCLSLLSLCCLSLFSLDLGLCHGFLLSLHPCVGLPSDLLRRGGLLLKSGGPLLHRGVFCLGPVVFCSALVGSSSVRSAVVGSSSVDSALASCSADSASVHSHSTSTWTWPSVPPPVPPPLHRPPGLYRSVWKPLFGVGGVCHESCPCTSVHSPPEVTRSPH